MTFSLSEYANISKIITDEQYAKEKYLNVKKISLPNNELFIIRYNKTFLNNENIHTLGLFRSVIVNNEGKILSFAPPKSMDIDKFIAETNNDPIEFSEFCEGTMINLFWNNDDWELVSRTQAGKTACTT